MVMVEMESVRQAPLQARGIWDYAQMTAPRREMTYLVLTHHHLDHCFAASYFDDRHALLYGHRSFSSCMAEMRKHLGQNDYQGMLMEMLKKLEIEKVVPGHGDIAGPEIIEQHIAILERKLAEAAAK